MAISQTGWSRERIKRYLVQRFYTRFHMSLILSSCTLAAMLVNWSLLHQGVHVMWVRYPFAVIAAYATFLAGVWLWLKYVGIGERSKGSVDAVDLLSFPVDGESLPSDINIGVGGGRSGGGGASAAWDAADEGGASSVGATAADHGSSGVFGKIGGFADLDGDGIVLLLIALSLVASIFLLSGYVIWFAPDILGEAVFGVMLSGGLVRQARRHDSDGWVEGVVRKTWWPFAIVFALSMALAIFSATHYPDASTLRQAVLMAIGT